MSQGSTRPKSWTIAPAAASANAICLSQKPGVGALTLNGALASGGVATLDYGRKVTVTSDANDSAHSVAIVGTDVDGYATSETIATGPSTGTVTSVNYYKTVSSITLSAPPTGNITAGTAAAVAVHKTIPLKFRSPYAASLNVDVTGTITFNVQQTFDDVFRTSLAPRSAYQNSQWTDVTALAAKSADTQASLAVGATAFHVQITAFTAPGQIVMTINQPERPMSGL